MPSRGADRKRNGTTARDRATAGDPARNIGHHSRVLTVVRAAPGPARPRRPTRRYDCAARAGPDGEPSRIPCGGGAGAAGARGNLWHRTVLGRYNGCRSTASQTLGPAMADDTPFADFL